ncbi:MAG: nitroreductase family protein [Bacillota bacterium]|nr:nitroreductase family protein [Bacillota bacterium]
MKSKTHFKVDTNKCIQCGRCVNVCAGMVLTQSKNGTPEMKDFSRYGWRGCWRCQHCLAVCPTGAISIFNKDPKDSLPLPPKEMGDYMEQLIVTRRSCRRFIRSNVDAQLITKMMNAMVAVPTGGNCNSVEYTIIDDVDFMDKIRHKAYKIMDDCAKKHIYTSSFDDFYYSKMKESEKSIRKGDLLFCGAPHIFIAHAKQTGKWGDDMKVNCNIATAYFELLANSYGLGTIIMSYPAEVIEQLVPEVKTMLGIPKNHYMGLIVGFGYPEIPYARGVQKSRPGKIHRYTQSQK